MSRRLTFVKRLYKGATLKDAADDVGKSQSTENLWAKRWNEDGLGKLTPNFGDRHPPKLGEDERERLLELLEDGEPWKKQEIQHLLNEKFDIEFHPNHLPQLLDDLGLSYAIPRTERPDPPEKADEILDERVSDAFAEDETDEPHNKQSEDDSDEEWTVGDDIQTDGGTTIGLFDISYPQPLDNSQRLYTVSEPTITRPLVYRFSPAAGFYALNGESVLQFPPNQKRMDLRRHVLRSLTSQPPLLPANQLPRSEAQSHETGRYSVASRP